MTNVEWLRPGVWGAIIGMAAVALLGFSVGGWQTAASSAQRAAEATKSGVTEALVPVCLDQSARDPSREARLALLQQASVSTRRDLLMDTGWATMPGTDAANRDVAQGCLEAMEIAAP